MTEKHDIPVAVIGAGPYGLAVAAHLNEKKIPYRIIGHPMDSWIGNMPKGMFLKSEGFASNISDPEDDYTLERFCAEEGHSYGPYGVPVALETFVQYGLWFQRQAVPQVEEDAVTSVSASPNGFELQTDAGETFRARQAVVATGHVRFEYVPPELQGLPSEVFSHSAAHEDLGTFAGKDVAVIGGGQSALETAALLAEHKASPSLIIRKPAMAWNEEPDLAPRSLMKRVRQPIGGLGPGWTIWAYSNLPRAFYAQPEERRIRIVRGTFGPSGAWWLRSRVEERVPVLLNHVVVGAEQSNGGVRLTVARNGDGPTELEADHVIAATGYRVDVGRLSFLDEGLRTGIRHVQGSPVLTPGSESSVPGLYFVGLPAANSFGPVMRFVFGTRYAGRTVSRQLARKR